MISLSVLFEQARLDTIPLDKKFHKTINIPNKVFDIDDKFDVPHSWWYTVLYNGEKAATTGIIIRGYPDTKHFFQIAVHQKFRGKGLVKICADLMFERFPKAKRLISVIDKKNIVSINAHKKSGFKEIESFRDDAYMYEKRRT